MKPFKLLCWVALLLLSSVACNLPAMSAPTPFVFPTADFTLTAIYSTLDVLTVTLPPQTPTLPPAVTETLPPAPPTPTVPAPTATPFPTPTPLPTATPLPPTVPPTNTPPPPTNTPAPLIRTASSIVANYLEKEPKIDGNLSEWKLPSYAVKHVVYGKDKWDNAADLSAKVMVAWDEANLYIGVAVTDEDYVQNESGINLYKGDSLEILFDTNLAADFYVKELSPDDFQLGISPGSPEPNTNPNAYLWFPTSLDGVPSGVRIAADRQDDGYTVEVAIPWDVFEITPQAGKHYGFAFSVSDNDKTGDSVQQTMISNVPDRRLTNPTTWGDLQLSKP